MVHIINLENGKVQVVETDLSFDTIMDFVKRNAEEVKPESKKKKEYTVEEIVKRVESENPVLVFAMCLTDEFDIEDVAKALILIADETEQDAMEIADLMCSCANGEHGGEGIETMCEALAVAMATLKVDEEHKKE